MPHRLYGHARSGRATLGRPLAELLVEPVLAAARAEGRPAIVVGGTGLYLHALLHGMPVMPEIPAALRAGLRSWAATVPAAAIHARLAACDPGMAAQAAAERSPTQPACARGDRGDRSLAVDHAGTDQPADRLTRAAMRHCPGAASADRQPADRGAAAMRCSSPAHSPRSGRSGLVIPTSGICRSPRSRACASSPPSAREASTRERAQAHDRGPDPTVRQAPAHLVPPPAARAAAGRDRERG